jgi:hypothetical protein
MPTELGFPLIVWQPMHAEIEYTFCPRPASPTNPGVNVRPSGVGVAGMLYGRRLSRGKTSPSDA